MLQSHLSQVEQFDQALVKFSQWGENMLSTLHSTAQINTTHLPPAMTQVKVRRTEVALANRNQC